jgi:hypothetical protein
MHQIKVIVTGTIQVKTVPTNLNAAVDLNKEARRNKGKVLEGALSVENQLVDIIAHYFHPLDAQLRAEFGEVVLNSDWCSFSAKRKLIEMIIQKKSVLQGKDLNQYTKLLHDTMAYRNAFAHGKLSSDDERVWLSYFEGQPRKVELSDDHLKKVEQTLRGAFQQTDFVAIQLGVRKPAEAGLGEASS